MTELKAMLCDGGCGARWVADVYKPTSLQSPHMDGWLTILRRGQTLHACSARCMGSIASILEHDPTRLERKELTT